MSNKILVVDDEPAWIRMISTFLKLAGYRVVAARNGEQAMDHAGAGGLDVIILDVNLEGENTAELLSLLQANQPEARVILYTGLEGNNRKVKKLMKHGAEYLQKGNLKELLGRLEETSREDGLVASGPRLVSAGWQVV